MRYLCANRPGLRADRPNRFSQPNLRADNGTRTRGLNLGKVALYQLSYVRNVTLTGNRVIHYPTAFTNGKKMATRLKFRGIGHRSLLLMSRRPPGDWAGGHYTVSDASRAAVQSFFNLSPAAAQSASGSEP